MINAETIVREIAALKADGFEPLIVREKDTESFLSAFPKECVQHHLMLERGMWTPTCYIKSPRPDIAASEIVLFSQYLRRRDGGTLSAAVTRLFALSPEDVKALSVEIKTRWSMAHQFSSLNTRNASEQYALRDVLPRECVWVSVYGYRSSYCDVDLRFRSPNPWLSVHDILPLARFLRQSGNMSQKSAIKQVLAMDEAEAIALRVAAALTDGCWDHY